MPGTLTTLRAEHRAIARLLHALEERVAQARRRAELPDFALLRAMLFWMAEFPERQHHRKESAALFPRLRARAPLARHVLDHLEEDHLRGEARIHQLEHALTAFELLGEPRRVPFETMLAEYLDFQRRHMVTEETQVFPLAERVLTSADWQDIDGELGDDLDTRGDACGVLFDALRPTFRGDA